MARSQQDWRVNDAQAMPGHRNGESWSARLGASLLWPARLPVVVMHACVAQSMMDVDVDIFPSQHHSIISLVLQYDTMSQYHFKENTRGIES